MNFTPSKRLHKDERKEQIIKSAFDVFIKKGFSATTTLEIAKASNVSEVTLFRYFSSKHEIFYAGIEPILFQALENVVSVNDEGLTSQILEDILYKRIKFLAENRGIIKLILNENILNQHNENYIYKMVGTFKTLLSKFGININDNFTTRILVGSFLSYLYLPETNDDVIREYVKKISNLILVDNN